MKHLSSSFGSVSILIVTTLFLLLTASLTFAQTATQARPATVDVNNIQSGRPVDAPKIAPVSVRFKEVQEVKNRGIENESTEGKSERPRTFLDKARSVLQERREGKVELSDDVEKTQVRKELRDSDSNRNNEERVAELKEKKQERVAKFLNNIKRKMDAAISRLIRLSERIESRIVKLEERGADMTEARRLLESAKSDIEHAQENIITAVENAREALAMDLSRDAFGGVVSELTKAKENLRSAHTSLVQVIRTMKNSITKDNETN